ncbi:MAG: CDP-alcohol phosphatidyltransferase family protein [Ignavibacteriae bacterium]|nr:CDP-alcohol phosphatidyltransferase family protein [Ignavibacteriota bacterium]MCB9217130.1 CDP-alcohol phosphatidyltransferase family protein [Ignavibacteria bacterium]
MSTVAETYKARDVEEVIDIWFYRRVGYRLALAAKYLKLKPNLITVIGITIGVIAGHFFFYNTLALNAIGMGLWVISNIFDSADGQLARMTGQTSQLGRILDGLGGSVVFASMYFHISFHYALNDGVIGWWIFIVALAAGASHSLQSAMADYYRNAFLRFGVKGGKSELERASAVIERYNQLTWRRNFFTKLFYKVYVNHTVQQETFSPKFQLMRDTLEVRYGNKLPDAIVSRYRSLNRPLLKYYNYLTINGRVLTLFAFVAIGYPTLFFIVELTLMNLTLWAVLRKQEKNNQEITRMAELEGDKTFSLSEAVA